MGYIQKEWLVYFYEHEHHVEDDWLFFLEKGFKHCGAMGYDPTHEIWTNLEYTHDGIRCSHLTPEEANSFMNEMSKPDSLNIDNLVELWRIKQGSGGVANAQPAQPSDAFNQQARAQQVASPMGVLPSQQPVEQSSEESIMDSMINDYKKNNPW